MSTTSTSPTPFPAGKTIKKIGKVYDLTGRRFGRWTALELIRPSVGYTQWLCRCDCGIERAVTSSRLIQGESNSCGCLSRELASKRFRAKSPTVFTHGLSKERIYHIWVKMIVRTKKPDKDYSDRGIGICERWEKFENFLEDMWSAYKEHVKQFGEKNTTIERVDNDKGYSLENCKWATLLEQARNKRNTISIVYNGLKKPLLTWAEELHMNKNALRYRITAGWDIERALYAPVNKPINAKLSSLSQSSNEKV